MKKNVKKETAASNKENLLFVPERTVIDAEAAARKAAKCSDYNDGRGEARNFNALEFNGVTFSGEDLSMMECHYSRFKDCIFENTKLSRMEAHFATFENCQWKNCEIENANFSFSRMTECNFYNSNLNCTDFPFVSGNIAATACMFERCTANNSKLLLVLSNTNALNFEANCAEVEFDVTGSCLRRAELNDSRVSGRISNTDLTNAELNRSDISGLNISDSNATNGIETEDADGFEDAFDKAIDEALEELD